MTHEQPGVSGWAPAKRRIDPIEEVMHLLPYGVYAVGSVEDGRPNAMIADWVMQVSFEPRMVAVAFERNSRSLGRIRANRAFTVNLLPGDQDGLELARSFVQPSDGAKIAGRSKAAAASQHDKLAGIPHTVNAAGCPLLDEALAWLSCEADQFVEAGDHVLVVGRVLDGRVLASGDALTSAYTGWTYSG
jgi:flavin reductase (DIM6/NTAB) family NADH-FMN oxidoreductase RutF